jgi:hypothetical protein
MADRNKQPFPHRPIAGGFIESICPICFLTIAREKVEADLEALEKIHDCRGFSLSKMLYPSNSQ